MSELELLQNRCIGGYSARAHRSRRGSRRGECMAERGATFGRLTTEELVTFRDLLLRITGRG